MKLKSQGKCAHKVCAYLTFIVLRSVGWHLVEAQSSSDTPASVVMQIFYNHSIDTASFDPYKIQSLISVISFTK